MNKENVIGFISLISILVSCYFIVVSFGLGILAMISKFGTVGSFCIVICVTVTMFRVLFIDKK